MKSSGSILSGNNIYLNIYGETVYYNTFDKNGYIVSKEVESKFRIFYHRYLLVCILLILLGDYFYTWQNTLLVGIGATILLELYFRLFFLKKLKVIKDFKRDRKTSALESIINRKEKEKTIMKACAYILACILLIINAIQQNYNLIYLILSGVAALYSLYVGIINIMAFGRMKKL